MKTPYEIGDTVWLAQVHSTQVVRPCQACFGKRTVDITLGDGEVLSVECEGCREGFNGPSGYHVEYDHTPKAVKFVVDKFDSYRDGHWWICGNNSSLSVQDIHLFADEHAALEHSRLKMAALDENKFNRRKVTKRTSTRASATVAYHRKEIKRLQEKIAYHQSKLIKPEVKT